MADNWGADFWGAFADVSKARMAQQLFQQQQQGKQAFGQAMTDPGIFNPSAPQGGAPQGGGGSPNIRDLINTTSQKYGLDPSLLTGEARIESGFNPGASNSSGAQGLFQFVPKTAAQYGLKNPFDAGASTDAAARLAMANRGILAQGLGRQPTNGEIYLAHQQGAGGALKLLKNPDAPAASLIGAKAVIQNGGRPDMTAGQFAQMWTSKFAQSQAHGAPAPTGGGAPQGGAPQGGPGQMPGQLTWPHIVQAIMAKNPSLDPKALAEAVDLFQPLMSQQSQMDWREQSLMLRQQAEQSREELGTERERLAADKAAVDAEHKAATEAQAATNEEGRNKRSEAKDQGIQKRFDITQDRLAKGLDQRIQEFKERVHHNATTEGNAKSKSDRDYALRQWKTFNDRRHQRAMEIIAASNATGMPAAKRKQMLDDEMARYNQEQADIDAMQPPGAAPAAPAAPQGSPPAGAPAPQPQAPAGAAPASPAPAPAPAAGGKTYTDPGEFSAALAKGAIKPGDVYDGKEWSGKGNVLDPSTWVPVKKPGAIAPQKTSAAAPSKPFIDFQTPSSMGKPESLLQAFFGG